MNMILYVCIMYVNCTYYLHEYYACTYIVQCALVGQGGAGAYILQGGRKVKRIRYPLKDLPLYDETYTSLSQAVAPIMKKKSYD